MMLNMNNSNIRLAYRGPFYIDVLSDMGSYLRQMYKLKPIISNRLYKIFFELTQNVAKYSVESSNIYPNYKYTGVGSFVVEENDNSIQVTTSNLIKKEDGPILAQYCNEVNNMTKEGLRTYRGLKRRFEPEEKDTGAYIGIIQLGIITQNKIDCKIDQVTDKFSIFTISARINKE